MKRIDAEMYRKCGEPHADIDALNDAFAGFHEAVQEAREKYRITEVQVILKARYISGDDELEGITIGGYGDSLQAVSMIAWALGKEQAAQQTATAKLLAGVVKAGSQRP